MNRLIEHKQILRDFLSKYIKSNEIDDRADIFASGFVNSLFAMELVMFIENHFKITVENEDLEFVNFSTIDNMARFIESKTAASQS